MAKYTVKGEEGTDVDVVGTIFHPGDTVELQEDVAAPLLEAGTIEAAPADVPASEAPAADAPAPADETPAADAPAADAPQG